MRWVLVAVVSVVAGVAGSLVGGIVFSPTGNQSAMNTASSFFGILAAVYVGSRVAPSPLRASRVLGGIALTLAVLGLALMLFFATTSPEDGEGIWQPLGQIAGAVLALMLIRARVGRRPTKATRAVGSAVTVVGGFLVLGGGAYALYLTIVLYGALWGPLGVIAVFALPPMWVAAPFVLWWVSGQFPLAYFAAWLATWVGAILAVSGQSLATGTETVPIATS